MASDKNRFGGIIKKYLLFLGSILWTTFAFSINPTISFINVGQGNCTIIDCKNKQKMIVDCGTSQTEHIKPPDITGSPSEARLASHIQRNYFPSLAQEEIVILITHPDKDHLNLLTRIFDGAKLAELKKVTIFLGGPLEDYFTTDTNEVLIEYFLQPSFSSKVQMISISYDLEGALLISALNQLKEETQRLLAPPLSLERNSQNLKDALYTYTRSNSQIFTPRGHLMGKDLKSFLSSSRAGDEFCSAFNMEILSANAGQTPNGFMGKYKIPFFYVLDYEDNTNSVVLKITDPDNTKSIILTGDATGVTTDQIVRYYKSTSGNTPDLQADVMLACHHGADTHESNNERWINATRPKTTILSCGRRLDYLHPSCNTAKSYYDIASNMSLRSHFLTCSIRKDKINPFTGFSSKEIASNDKGRFIRISSLDRDIYSTHDSGTIKVTFEADKIMMEVGEGSFTIPPRDAAALTASLTSDASARAAGTPHLPGTPAGSGFKVVRALGSSQKKATSSSTPDGVATPVFVRHTGAPTSGGHTTTLSDDSLDGFVARHYHTKVSKPFGSPVKRSSAISGQMKREIGNIIAQLNEGVRVGGIRTNFSVDELKIINAHKGKSVDEIIRILDGR